MGPLRRHRSRAICAIRSEAACGVLALAAMATASADETWSQTPSEPKMSTLLGLGLGVRVGLGLDGATFYARMADLISVLPR